MLSMGDDGATRRITPEELKRLCKEQRLYSTASLNEKLYLHYRGEQRPKLLIIDPPPPPHRKKPDRWAPPLSASQNLEESPPRCL